MNKKKLLSTMLSIIFVVALFVAPVSAASTGSWKTGKARASLLTYNQEKIFDKAMVGITGVSYMPVALLAKQVVNGTNYVYLTYGTTITRTPKSAWYVITVHKNGKKVSVKYINKMTPANVKTNSKPRKLKTLSGGLAIQPQIYQPAALSASAMRAFEKAAAKYTKYSLRPLGLLGYQTVSGKNYRVLCYGTAKNVKDIFVVTVYKKTNGTCEVSSCKALNLEHYVK